MLMMVLLVVWRQIQGQLLTFSDENKQESPFPLWFSVYNLRV